MWDIFLYMHYFSFMYVAICTVKFLIYRLHIFNDLLEEDISTIFMLIFLSSKLWYQTNASINPLQSLEESLIEVNLAMSILLIKVIF